MNEDNWETPDLLAEKAVVKEQPFVSRVPAFGPLIAWFRAAWNSVATKWYVRHLVQQQNSFNQLLVEQLRQAEQRLLELDRHNTELTREVARLTAQLAQLRRRLEEEPRGQEGDG